MHMQQPKKKSQKRFEQLNRIVDDIAPTLPTSTHVAALLVCFRHGRGAGFFRVSTRRLAKSIGVKVRQTKSILDDLEQAGVIVLTKEHQGPIPRTYRITFKPANGAAHCTNKPQPTPQLNGAAQCS